MKEKRRKKNKGDDLLLSQLHFVITSSYYNTPSKYIL